MAKQRPGRNRDRSGPSLAQEARPYVSPGGLPLAFVVVAVLIVALSAYSNSFSGVLVFDDLPAIEENQNLRHLWPLSRAMTAPPSTTLEGRPIASLSFALDYAVWNDPLWGFHATNLTIHILAALLVFGLVQRTLQSPPLRATFGSAGRLLALLVALVFAVHPLQTASVTYVVQRVESLMGLFYLATLYGAVRARERPGFGGWAWFSLAMCALGMGTKEVMVTAPIMVVVWDHLFGGDATPSKRPLYIGLFAAWAPLITLVAGGARTGSAGFGFSEWPWWGYLATQAEVLPHYLRLVFYPAPLVLDYDWSKASVSDMLVPGLLITGFLAATIFGLVRRLAWSFAGVWFFLILAPTSSILPIPTEIAAEHRMYLPILAPIVLVATGAFMFGSYSVRRVPLPSGPLHLAALTIAVALIATLTLRTRERNDDYRTYDRIWSDTVDKRPHNARARNNLASSLLSRGQFAEAEAHLLVAVGVQPGLAEAQANLGVALSAQGKVAEGSLHLQKAIELKPRFAEAHRNLGENYAIQGRFAQAVDEYTQALSALPGDVRLLNRLAWILATSPDDRIRDGRKAVAYAERAVEGTRRQDPVSLDSLGVARAELGDYHGAEAAVGEAVALARNQGDSNLLAELMTRAGLFAQGLTFRQR